MKKKAYFKVVTVSIILIIAIIMVVLLIFYKKNIRIDGQNRKTIPLEKNKLQESSYSANNRLYKKPRMRENPIPTSFNPEIWGDLLPNSDRTVDINMLQDRPLHRSRTYSFHINNMGFRGTDQNVAPDTWKAIVLGDGFAFGTGLSGEQDIASQLDIILENGLPNTSIAVFNGGIPGYTITDEIDYIREKGSLMKPNLVIIIVAWDDKWEIERPIVLRREQKKLLNNPIQLIYFERFRRMSGIFRFKEAYLKKTGLTEPAALKTLIPKYIKLAIALKKEVSKWKGNVLFVLSDSAEGDPNEILAEQIKRAKLNYIYIKKPKHIDIIYQEDGHWNREMCGFIATEIKNWIMENKLLDS